MLPIFGRSLRLAVLVGVLALAFSSEEPLRAQEAGAMAVDCDGATAPVDAACALEDGQQFKVTVHVARPPEGGYAAFQARLQWNEAVLDYFPTELPEGEALWPPCATPARTYSRRAVFGYEPTPYLLFACVPLPRAPLQAKAYQDTGPVLRFTFACAGRGRSDIALVPPFGAALLETYFVDPSVVPLAPATIAATVTCREPAVNEAGMTRAPAASGGPGPPPAVWALTGLLAMAAVAGLTYSVRAGMSRNSGERKKSG